MSKRRTELTEGLRFIPPARFLFRAAIIALLAALVCLPGGGVLDGRIRVRAADPTVWSLVWDDEFDGANGAGVDPSKWTAETGGGGWGNNELETYTSRTQNAFLSNGSLNIKAIKETFKGTDGITRDYTSARLKTQAKFEQAYGRFEARVKIPYGQGLWPAFWMLGDDISTSGWPTCGEIDIMENIGREPSTVHGTMHGPGYSGANGIGAAYALPAGKNFSDDFHTFSVEWEPNVARFYVDGILYKTTTPANLPAGARWVFDHPFFIILNVAVGGTWPGSPDQTTVFPQTMQVDYVRVYQRSVPSSVPAVLTDESSGHAIALDSETLLAEPFAVVNDNNISQDHRTRLALFVANLDLLPGDDASVVAAQAEDSQAHVFPLTVEAVGRVPQFDWITEVVVKLPDELSSLDQTSVSVRARGQSSNKAVVAISH
ncbi:MAG TPA: glycoside hydrolase family 16 protein [Pyrinomonadaceae bacterium]|nr:glycoside hydrolase family 16 protein [Pyrinomonadaceae bacterium]